jgi:hypothetical protein
MGDGSTVLFVLCAIVILIVGIAWHATRSRSVLDQWADENGFEILHSEYRHMRLGPFFWTSSKGQTVYYVHVRDQQGRERMGWVRCGGWFLGLMSNKAEVRWDDKA